MYGWQDPNFTGATQPGEFDQGQSPIEAPDAVISLLYDNFIPQVDRDNPAFRRFFSIIEGLYSKRKAEADKLNKLLWYDENPDKYLFRIAQYLGFPLLDAPFASESERRNMLKYSAWIWKRKGTRAALEKLFSILGFTSYIEEESAESAIFNAHGFYSLNWRTTDLVTHDFNGGTAEGWEKQNTGSTWEVKYNKFYGTGDGTSDPRNSSIIANSFYPFYMQTDFQIVGGSGASYPCFGVLLSYNGLLNCLWVYFYSDGGNDYMSILGSYLGVAILSENYNITGKVAYKSGNHTMKIHVFNDNISIGIDDTTLIKPFHFENIQDFWPMYFKGLNANQSTEVAFDDVEIRRLKTLGSPRFAGAAAERKLWITLSGSPDNEIEKREYLADVIKHFIPHGIEVEWVA
jgi:Phage tail protein (Tail_P2_I)